MTALPACCLDLQLELRQLLFPETLDAAGWEFYSAHGLDRMTLTELQSRSRDLGIVDGERKVEIKHRCAQLQNDGRCGIYKTRPAICRAFDCATRTDCACHGAGLIPVEDLFADA
jgi:Fe-S-cluster containining protein